MAVRLLVSPDARGVSLVSSLKTKVDKNRLAITPEFRLLKILHQTIKDQYQILTYI